MPLRRFSLDTPGKPGGDPGRYHEALVQWLLEHTFFLDFVYRNPAEHGGRGELGDAVVLFDDLALMVQIKAQFSRRDPLLWARKELKKAAKQLRHTNRMLFGGHVRESEDPLFGKVPFNPCGCPENADGNAYVPEAVERINLLCDFHHARVGRRPMPTSQNLIRANSLVVSISWR